MFETLFNRTRILTIIVLALALGASAGASAAGTAAPAGQTATAEVAASLQQIEAGIDLLEADVARSEHRDAAPPPFFLTKVDYLGHRIDDALRHLVGLHWTVVDPLLDRGATLHGRLEALKTRLENWQPHLPPDPNRPLKTSAATGTGAISGTLTDEATGNPIPYTRVEVYCPDPDFDADTMTDATGAYTMGGLGTGDCYVRTWNQQAFIDEYYDDVPCPNDWCYWGDGTPVHVIDGQTTTGIDFALTRYGEIRGTLTDAQDGTPVSLEYVLFFDSDGVNVASSQTDGDGHFAVLLPAGDFFVMTNVVPDYHVNEVYDDLPCNQNVCDPTVGTPVTVASGQITAGIDFALDRPGTISGTVTDAETGEPSLPYVLFSVYDPAGNFITSGYGSEADGSYTVGRLASGSYYIRARDSSHVPEVYDDVICTDPCDPTTGTPVAVTVATDTPGIDFALEPMSTVSGTVTDSLSGLPIGGAFVSVYDDSGSYKGGYFTGDTGAYGGVQLFPGTYFARASHDAHITELYQEIPCPYSCDPTGGTPIVLPLGSGVSGIDFTLDPDSHIAGTVVSVGGAPIPDVGVEFYDSGGVSRGYTSTDASGNFVSPGLPAGSFFVVANASWLGWIPQLYDGHDCPGGCDPTTGDPVVTTVGGTTSITFSLTPWARILGTVTDDVSGDPIAYAQMALYDSTGTWVGSAQTAGDGTYIFRNLGTGTYRVVAGDLAYIDELYDDIPCEGGCDVNLGTPIGVTVGSDTTGIDFALHRMGSISGSITDALDGGPVSSYSVALYDAAGTRVKGTTTASNGQFTFVGLGAGTYFVATDGGFGSYEDELYDDIPCEGGCDVTTGTPIVVTDGQDTGGIDFVLEPTPVFDDVPVGYWARYWIETLYHNGVTSGCATDPLRYCPASPVSRGQMAVFLLASKEGEYYNPPPAVGIFSDVPASDPLAPWIEELAARGVTAGCGGGMYCPNDPVTRRQMAVFLLSTLEGPLYSPPPAVGLFNDVPAGDPFAPWIEELAHRGITAGCGGGNFCPGDIVPRDQMAVFLVTTFGLQ